ADDERERVKQRFYRSATADFSGSGLGLSIVKRIAELHGGALDIKHTESGSGVLLQVELPLCRQTASDRATQSNT
ncbi:MAG: hypothetical protein K9J42_14405, partial [Sulfuritalea sp.]|nr:hypothetical protein [Sulfuritalea sp.]